VVRPDGKRDHALRLPPFDPPGPPFLPTEGEIYWVASLFYYSNDPAPARPAVVLEVPALASARIRIVTRTSKTVTKTGKPAPGIKHLADAVLGLDRDGVFSDPTSVERFLWCPHHVKLCGRLDEATWKAVQERFL
jgi:mRNA-degrading endonuclease toxin of MazEF toxin-antitoxin module